MIKQLFSLFDRKSFYVFILFYVIVLLFYFPSRHAGFFTDFIGFEAGYSKCGFIHYYDCSSMPNLRYVQHLFSYILWKTVGPDTIYWYFLYCFFHALAAYFGFLVAKKILKLYAVQNAILIALVSSILFLISPYQAEVVVWRVCIQYCFVSIALSVNILLLLSYFKNPKAWKPIFAFVIFCINMFAIEQAAIIPIVFFVIIVLLNLHEHKNAILKLISIFTIPQVLFVGFYFLLSKIMYHKWIMHYGEKSFDHVLSVDTYAKFFRYFFKYVFLIRFIENEQLKGKIFHFISHPIFLSIATILLFILFVKLIQDFLTKNNKAGLYLMLIMICVVSLLPVIQLYDTTLLLSENDRLGYISSFFIFMLVAIFLLDSKNKVGFVLVGILIISNAYYLLKINHFWNISNKIAYGFAKNFKDYDRKEIVVLGLPDDYKGIWMYRLFTSQIDNSSLKEAVNFKLHKQIPGTLYEIAYYNQTAYENAINVRKENDSTLYVTFSQYGNWWWKNGVGMSSYENEKFKVVVDKWNGYYLIMKDYKNHHYTFIYPDNLHWKEFVLN